MTMIRQGRSFFGIAALLCLVLFLNILVWKQAFFSPAVLLPLGLSLLFFIGWLICLAAALAEHRAIEGRTAGGLGAAVSTILFLGICIVLYLFLSAWKVSWDLTEEGRRSLSTQTVQVLQSMNTEVEVLCFFLQVEEELVTIARDKTLRFLDACREHTSLMKVEMLDPTIDRARLEAMNITHASVQGTIVLRAGDRQRVILLTGGSPRLEERDFTNALINVLRKSEPKVYFLTGHRERDILEEDEQSGANIFGKLLQGEAYQVDRLGIKISDPEIPMDADVLVINNPVMDFHPVEIEALNQFMDRGGRLLLLMDPWRAPPAGTGEEKLRPFLEKRFGIRVGSDIVITNASDNIWRAELTVDDEPFEMVEEGFMEFRGSFNRNHPITGKFDQTLLLQAMRSVTPAESVPAGVALTELVRTTPDFWAESDAEKLLQTGQAQQDAEEKAGPVSLAVAGIAPADKSGNPKGKGDTRIVVVGDSDFAANANIIIPGNLNFLLNIFAWLTESEDLIAMRPTGREALPLILTAAQQRTLAWVSILFTVQTIVLAGIAVHLVRRKSR